MTRQLRDPLYAWIVLTLITTVSWWIGHNYALDYDLDGVVTVCVLLMAAAKSVLVMRYFMEVRYAPAWLKMCTYGVVGVTFALLLGIYHLRPW